MSPLKLTMGTLRTRGGLIVNLVTLFLVESHTTFSRTLCVGSFFDLCTVTADTSKIPKPKIKNPRGKHHEVFFEVALLFGLTELKAQLVWVEDGVEKRWVQLPPRLTILTEGEQGASQNNLRPS